MDLFFDKNDISNQKRRKLNDNIEKYFNEQKEHEKILNEIEQNNNKVFIEEVNMNILTKKEREYNQLLNENTNKYNKSVEDLFKSFLSETFVESLNIDKALIEENREEIVNKINNVYDTLKEEINYDNIIINNVYNKCKTAISESMNAFKILDILEEDINNISSIVRNKVSKVLSEESKLSDIEIKNESGNYEETLNTSMTLFKECYLENVKATINEVETLNESAEYSKEDIMESSYLETIVDYTLLEMLNTTEMYKFKDNFYEDAKNRKIHKRCGIEL